MLKYEETHGIKDGILKDKFSPVYDPRMSNSICATGQLLLIDLAEKIEVWGKAKALQYNTDAVQHLLKRCDIDEYVDICEKWVARTRLVLEYDYCNQYNCRDVNTYIMRFEKDKIDKKTGRPIPHLEQKGGLMKKPSLLDNDLPILRVALTEFFLNGTDPYDTIYNPKNKLMDYQKIVKISSKYDGGIQGDKISNEKVNRVFATTNEKASRFYKYKWDRLSWKDGLKNKPLRDWLDKMKNTKVKYEDYILEYNGDDEDWLDKMRKLVTVHNKGGHVTFLNKIKVGDTPDKARIENDNIVDKSAPGWLDLEYYHDLAKTRLKSFYTAEQWKEVSKNLK